MRHRWKSETMKLCMEPAHCSLCAVSKNGQDATHEELWEAVKKLDVIIATKDELIHSYVRVMTLLSKEKNDD